MHKKRRKHPAPFGVHLRQLREAAGLTQEELAARAGLSAKAISMLERGERQRPFPHTVRTIADALELSEKERATLLAAVPKRDSAATPDAPATVSKSNLPTPSTFLLGRERELGQIRTFLPEVRLLTLTGTGGVGKTRLAIQAAHDAARLFPDGVAFVALAPLSDFTLVLPTIAQSLGLREAGDQTLRGALSTYLREKRLLLVLDNFEHVLEAAPELADLIESCPNLRVLVTSRTPLRLRGEQEYPVSPLTLPTSTISPAVEEVLRSGSGRLFAERARAASPDFELTARNAGAVATICWQRAGIPLALELAAARVRFVSPASLLSRLDWALSEGGARDLPERQRTMWAALEWSHELLTEGERILFRRLSVFAGGFSLEAAEEVGATEGVVAEGVLGLLGQLVEHSLIQAQYDEKVNEVRYGMLEPVRQYSRHKLEKSGEAEDAQRRHFAYFLGLTEAAEAELMGTKAEAWMDRLEGEHDNLRAALGWAKERGEATAGLRLAGALNWFWWTHGHLEEGRGWTEAFLEAAAREAHQAVEDDVRAKALFGAGRLAFARGELGRSVALFEESLMVYRKLKDEGATAAILAELGQVVRARGDLDRAKELSEEGLHLSRALENHRSAAISLNTLGHIARRHGDLERARGLFEEALALFEKLDDRRGVAYSLGNLGVAALERGQLGAALDLHEEALSLYETLKDKAGRAFALINLGDVARRLGEERRAVSLYEEGLTLHRELGNQRGISRALDRLEAGTSKHPSSPEAL